MPDFVDELGGDGVDRDGAAGAGVLGDNAGTIGGYLGDREADVRQVGAMAEPGEVAAGRVRTALDHVTGGGGTRELVEVIALPAVCGDSGSDEGGVGDATGDDDIGAGSVPMHLPVRREVAVQRASQQQPLGAQGADVILHGTIVS